MKHTVSFAYRIISGLILKSAGSIFTNAYRTKSQPVQCDTFLTEKILCQSGESPAPRPFACRRSPGCNDPPCLDTVPVTVAQQTESQLDSYRSLARRRKKHIPDDTGPVAVDPRSESGCHDHHDRGSDSSRSLSTARPPAARAC